MFTRIGIYVKEVFSLSYFIGIILAGMATSVTYIRLYQLRPRLLFDFFMPAVVLLCVSLLLRIINDFKYYQQDLSAFPHKPLPAGRVQKGDLIFLGQYLSLLILALSVTSWPLLLWSGFILVYIGLMMKWFFMEERLRKSQLLSFIAHHAIVLLSFLYLIIYCTQLSPLIGWQKIVYLLPLVLMFTNWGIISSSLFQPRVRVGLALGLQIIFNATVLVTLNALKAPWYLMAIFILLQLLLMMPFGYFLKSLKEIRPLKQLAKGQIWVVVLTLMIASLL